MADSLTPSQRSYCMSRIRAFNTGIEIALRKRLFQKGLRYRTNVQSLPGRPDLVFLRARVIVFVDGDFWHGFRFSQWRTRLPDYWQAKIERNRKRDARNHRRLRVAGWCVIRLWGHDVHRDLERCVKRISDAVSFSPASSKTGRSISPTRSAGRTPRTLRVRA